MYFTYIFPRKYKVLLLLAAAVILWMLFVKLSSMYVISKSYDDEKSIIDEKNNERIERCRKLTDRLIARVDKLSSAITENGDVRRDVEKGDVKRLYETVKSADADENTGIEIFDKRLESVCFTGSQVTHEIILMQRAVNGNASMVIRETGFFTYLIKYTPIKSFTNETSVTGVAVVSVLIDSKYSPSQFEIPGNVLSAQISREIGKPVHFESTGQAGILSTDTTGMDRINITTGDRKSIGRIIYPRYTLIEHVESIERLAGRSAASLAFLLTLFIIPVMLRLINLFRPATLRITLFLIFLVLLRYLWILTGCPAEIFQSQIFQTHYFAVKFGLGMFKSLGDLLVTVLFTTAFSLYTAYVSFDYMLKYRNEEEPGSSAARLIKMPAVIALFFLMTAFYGASLRSLMYDSNIKILDKVNIIPEPPLFILQLSILLISFSYFVFEVIFIFVMLHNFRQQFRTGLLKKYYILISLLIFLLVNFLIFLSGINLELVNFQRIFVIALLFIYAVYLSNFLVQKRSFSFFSLRNISVVFLLSMIVTPVIMLDITKSQETRYIENIGSELVENQNDKIVYLISDELGKFKDDRELETYIKDDSKTQKLAFYLWSESKFSYAKYKSDLMVLDTSGKVISDFNTSNSLINSDSVSSFLKRNYFASDIDFSADESDSTFADEDDESYLTDEGGAGPEPVTFDNITIFENRKHKYFAGIIPLEKVGLRNTEFEEVIGYVVIALNSENINFYSENEFNAKFDGQEDAVPERLLSRPVLTEILNGDVINSTNIDISRALLKYLPQFEESIKNSDKPVSWRYDMLMNERYRTYYIQSPVTDNEENGLGLNDEKIFSVSIKRDDFGLLSFYFLKFVLFSLTVFTAISIVYLVTFLFRLKHLSFNFREKLFLSFIIVSVIPIVFLAIYTRSYINNKNDITYRNQMLSDLNILNETLKDEKILFNKYKQTDTIKQAGKDILNKNFGNTDKNYNIFIRNKLIASTNEELYKSDFLDTRVDAEGHFNISVLRKDVFIQNVNIRGQNYLVGYKPLKDRNNNINGIISSLSVYKQKEIHEELTETLTFIFGSYFIVIMILLIVVSFVTAKISKPILALQKATEKLAKGEEDFVIDIERSDELGSLVDSFNKMTKDLAKSKNRLKKAEREAAWRDIARRVAHEIKNPLTPMKLSIQHLYFLYQEKDFENFEAVLKKTKELIINEIDKLNRIATAFSDFAKLPSRNYEPLNVNEILTDVVSLYSLNKNVSFVNELQDGVFPVLGDKQELNRVFQNLIKNAVQSIPGEGVITVLSYNLGKHVIVEITDNGCGIEPEILGKLFEPNFSTKSTGMGLGLAITKKSLEDMKAEISITSKVKEGTTVRIEFLKHGKV
ncbi:MAG: ATP-binding protein [Bacteroidetes bacterium]|nr:ATP-binding protein [Bacteroidota bacterium]